MKNLVYKNFTDERNFILSQVPNKKEIERKIIYHLKKNMAKNKSKYFNLNDLIDIPQVKQYFQFIAITGDRNIGKTTAMRNYIKNNLVEKNEEYIWLRNKDTEIKNLLQQEKQTFFDEFGWDYTITNGTIYSSTQAKKEKNTKEIIGHYKAINNIQNEKSIEYKNVSTIFYDEFNAVDNIANKFTKLVQFITTIERQKTNFQIILAANYIKQNDEILINLGLSQEKKTKQPLIIFNWIAGAILWNIPKNWYTNFRVKKSLGYRLSHINFSTYQEQYAGTFENRYIKNIINLEKIHHKKELFSLFHNRKFYTFYSFGKLNDRVVFLSNEIFGVSKPIPIYCFEKVDKYNSNGLKIIPLAKVKALKKMWNEEKLVVNDAYNYNILISLFDNFDKQLDNQNLVNYIE